MSSDNIIPKLSICIPAYKHNELLARCLNSLEIQNFRDFEVIITDDTPDDSIQLFVLSLRSSLEIRYFKNEKPLGSPANWNKALSYAKGEYVKIIHHDDWLASSESLTKYVAALDNNPQSQFAFSYYQNVNDQISVSARNNIKERFLVFLKDKSHLITDNFFGDPSTSIFRRTNISFDEKMKWCVDYDFYLQQYEINNNVILIEEVLVNIGTHEGQITHSVINDANVVVYENIRFYNKHYFGKLSMKQFDFFWRMIRNYRVDSIDILVSIAKGENVAYPFKQIVQLQNKFTYSFLKKEIPSKVLMLFCFIKTNLFTAS
jgi:glycosyltransferase involved in cell wall biosynthesis